MSEELIHDLENLLRADNREVLGLVGDRCHKAIKEIQTLRDRIAKLERDKKTVTMEIERVKRKAEEYDIDGYDQPRMAKYMAVKRVCVSLLAFIRKLKEADDAKYETDK